MREHGVPYLEISATLKVADVTLYRWRAAGWNPPQPANQHFDLAAAVPQSRAATGEAVAA
jgi:hypothetical protein